MVSGIGIVCCGGSECLYDIGRRNYMDFSNYSDGDMEWCSVVADIRIICGGFERDELRGDKPRWDHLDGEDGGGE